MAISILGLSIDDVRKRIACIRDAWRRAEGTLITDAVVAHTAQDMVGLLAGAVAMVVASALVILIGNVGGSVLGGAFGGFTTGGAGAVPGALAGRLIGNYFATATLQLLGVGLLIAFIASELDGIGKHFYLAVDCAWNSAEMAGELYEMRMAYSAKHFAEGIGKFFGALVMALVIVLTRGKAEEKARVLNSKLMKICDGLQTYIGNNLQTLQVKYRPGLQKATVTAGLPETPEGLVGLRAAARLARPFGDMPNFQWMRVSALRAWLRLNRFVQVAEVRKPGQYLADGTKATDFKSEIWMRQRTPFGDIECVRIDPHAHVNFPVRDGPFRFPSVQAGGRELGLRPGSIGSRFPNPGTGGRSAQQIAWGERPHYHMDTIPAAKATAYQNKYVPDAVTFEANGRIAQEVANEGQLVQLVSRLFGPGAAECMARTKFDLIHIPLMPE